MEKEKKEEDFKATDTIDVGAGETGLSSEKEEKTEEKVEPSEKVEEKKEEDTSPEVEELRAKLEKAEAEKDNYKKGLLSSKKKLKSLDPEPKKKEEEKEENEWDDESSKFQKETLDKSKEYAKEALYEVHSKTAIQKFVATYPETDKAEIWKDIASAYTARRGKDSVENIVSDIEDAYLLVKRDRGELSTVDEVLKSEQAGFLKAQSADLGSVKGKGGKTEKAPDKSANSQGAIDMAKAFRQDPDKVAKENDKTTAEIEL